MPNRLVARAYENSWDNRSLNQNRLQQPNLLKMKACFFLSFLFVLISSCSDEEHLFGPASEATQNSESAGIEDYIRPVHTDEVSTSGEDGPAIDICVSDCYKSYKRDYDFLLTLEASCEALRTKKTVVKDKICTRQIFVRWEIESRPPDPDVRVPVYRTESYVCGQESTTIVIPLADETSAVRSRYQQCKTETREEFLTELEKIQFKYDKCTKRCKDDGGSGGGGGGIPL